MIVLATGCFDILHPGHIRLLEHARQYGLVWVGVNSDRAVRELKGPTRPINCAADRIYVLQALACVHLAFEIDDVKVAKAILEYKPRYWIKGGDYTLETLDSEEVAAANEVGSKIIIFPTVGQYSTTKMLAKL